MHGALQAMEQLEDVSQNTGLCSALCCARLGQEEQPGDDAQSPA